MFVNICQNVEYLPDEHKLQFFSTAAEHAAHIFEMEIYTVIHKIN